MLQVMSETKLYKINEIFYSLQGEGYHTGTPAIFLRFSGCNRKCTFCDTDFSAFTEMNAEEIVATCAAFPARHIVVTGGEPLLQLDTELIDLLHEKGFFIQIETNGSLRAPESIDWVTCSPKYGHLEPQRVDELKIVFEGEEKNYEALAELYGAPNLFLQPCSGKNIAETIDYIKAHPHWRLSLQTHKLTGIR